MEVLITVVDDVVLWAACSDETHTLEETRNNLHVSVFIIRGIRGNWISLSPVQFL